jgi:alkane 1-monooxygenase
MSKATTAAASASKAAGASISLTATASASKAAGSAASTFADAGGPTRLGRLFLRALPPNSRRHFLPAFVMPLVPVLAAALASRLVAGPLAVAAGLLGVAYAFGIMPALDAALGDDVSAASAEQAARLADDPAFRTLLRAYAAWHLMLLAAAFHLAAAGAAGWAALAAAGASAGVSNGILFVVAHELLHGGGADRALAGALLAPLCYCHWAQSHLAHHVKVATRADPSTARRGEPLWRFLARSIGGNLADGLAAERTRRARRGVPAWSPRNRALRWAAAPSALAAAAYYLYDARGLLFFTLQAAGGVLMLETVNYIEH